MDNNTNNSNSATDRASNLMQLDRVDRDIIRFGQGYYRIHPDGRVEHIPFNEMHIQNNVRGHSR